MVSCYCKPVSALFWLFPLRTYVRVLRKRPCRRTSSFEAAAPFNHVSLDRHMSQVTSFSQVSHKKYFLSFFESSFAVYSSVAVDTLPFVTWVSFTILVLTLLRSAASLLVLYCIITLVVPLSDSAVCLCISLQAALLFSTDLWLWLREQQQWALDGQDIGEITTAGISITNRECY